MGDFPESNQEYDGLPSLFPHGSELFEDLPSPFPIGESQSFNVGRMGCPSFRMSTPVMNDADRASPGGIGFRREEFDFMEPSSFSMATHPEPTSEGIQMDDLKNRRPLSWREGLEESFNGYSAGLMSTPIETASQYPNASDSMQNSASKLFSEDYNDYEFPLQDRGSPIFWNSRNTNSDIGEINDQRQKIMIINKQKILERERFQQQQENRKNLMMRQIQSNPQLMQSCFNPQQVNQFNIYNNPQISQKINISNPHYANYINPNMAYPPNNSTNISTSLPQKNDISRPIFNLRGPADNPQNFQYRYFPQQNRPSQTIIERSQTEVYSNQTNPQQFTKKEEEKNYMDLPIDSIINQSSNAASNSTFVKKEENIYIEPITMTGLLKGPNNGKRNEKVIAVPPVMKPIFKIELSSQKKKSKVGRKSHPMPKKLSFSGTSKKIQNINRKNSERDDYSHKNSDLMNKSGEILLKSEDGSVLVYISNEDEEELKNSSISSLLSSHHPHKNSLNAKVQEDDEINNSTTKQDPEQKNTNSGSTPSKSSISKKKNNSTTSVKERSKSFNITQPSKIRGRPRKKSNQNEETPKNKSKRKANALNDQRKSKMKKIQESIPLSTITESVEIENQSDFRANPSVPKMNDFQIVQNPGKKFSFTVCPSSIQQKEINSENDSCFLTQTENVINPCMKKMETPPQIYSYSQNSNYGSYSTSKFLETKNIEYLQKENRRKEQYYSMASNERLGNPFLPRGMITEANRMKYNCIMKQKQAQFQNCGVQSHPQFMINQDGRQRMFCNSQPMPMYSQMVTNMPRNEFQPENFNLIDTTPKESKKAKRHQKKNQDNRPNDPNPEISIHSNSADIHANNASLDREDKNDSNQTLSLQQSLSNVFPLTKQEREMKILKYKNKRMNRNFTKKISYECRKRVAENRYRIRGRFVTKERSEIINQNKNLEFEYVQEPRIRSQSSAQEPLNGISFIDKREYKKCFEITRMPNFQNRALDSQEKLKCPILPQETDDAQDFNIDNILNFNKNPNYTNSQEVDMSNRNRSLTDTFFGNKKFLEEIDHNFLVDSICEEELAKKVELLNNNSH